MAREFSRDAASQRTDFHSGPDRGAEYCDERVCVCVCLSAIIASELHVIQNEQLEQVDTIEVTSQVATPGAESAVYDCLVHWENST